MMRFCIYPQSRGASDAEVRRFEVASSLSVAECARDWSAGDISVETVTRAEDATDDAILLVLVEMLDQAGYLAWHDVLDGRPHSLILADPNSSMPSVWQISGSHEMYEISGNPYCDKFVTLANGDIMPQENADPTEGDVRLFDIGDGEPVPQSNYVTPLWFDSGATGKIDALGVCQPTIVRPGGYAKVIKPDGRVVLVGQGPASPTSIWSRYARCLANCHVVASKIRSKIAC